MREREEAEEKEEEVEEEEEEDHVRGPEEEVWGDGQHGEVPQPEESGGDDDTGDDFGGEAKGKRKCGGGGGGGGSGKKAARGTATPPSFTSSYRGVLCLPRGARRWKAQFKRNGKQTSLGHFDAEEGAAHAYDRMAVWCHLHGLVKKGPGGNRAGSFLEDLNFDYAEYQSELEELGRIPQDDLVLKPRRGEGTRASASSKFRGVSWVRDRRLWEANFKHHSKLTRLGRFATEEGAARAYDCMMVWFKLHKVVRKGGDELNFAYAEYKGELEELRRMTHIEVVAKLRLQAQVQLGAHREEASNAEGDEAGEGAGGVVGCAKPSGDVHVDSGGVGEDQGDGLSLDGAPAPHPNFLRWWRMGPLG